MRLAVEPLILAAVGFVAQFGLALGGITLLGDRPSPSAIAIALGTASVAGLFGFVAGRKEVYSLEPRAVWALAVDVSWSAINTLTGLCWMLWCARRGPYQPPTPETRKRGIVVFSGAALPGAAATTLGTVVGGEWLLHEAVHVQQARIFGPLYWPIYLSSYVLNLAVRGLTGRLRDIHWQAYGRVVMEDWAYRATPRRNAAAVERRATVIWCGIAVLHGLCLIQPLASLVGVIAAPWWIGPTILTLYALVRSFGPSASA